MCLSYLGCEAPEIEVLGQEGQELRGGAIERQLKRPGEALPLPSRRLVGRGGGARVCVCERAAHLNGSDHRGVCGCTMYDVRTWQASARRRAPRPRRCTDSCT